MPNANDGPDLSKVSIFGLGALGGVIPILLNFLSADLPAIFNSQVLSAGNFVGAGLKDIVLIGLGGILAALNVGVKQPLTLVQLGIAAPAIFTAYVNSGPTKVADAAKAASAFVSSAYAAEAQPGKIVLAGFWDDLLRGATSKLSDIKITYAVVNLETKFCQSIVSDDAKDAKLAELRKNFPAPTYSVTVGNCVR